MTPAVMRHYGPVIGGIALLAVSFWVLVLIGASYAMLLEFSFKPERWQTELAVVGEDKDRASNCLSEIKFDLKYGKNDGGGLGQGIPSATSMMAPSASVMAAPSATNNAAAMGACDRFLSSGKPVVEDDSLSLADQKVIAEQLLAQLQNDVLRLEKEEAEAFVYGIDNYLTIFDREIPRNSLLLTIISAFCVTIIGLMVCYPIAYALSGLSRMQAGSALFLALVIPYAVNELMRIYAWLAIIDTKAMLNRLLDKLGLIPLEAAIAWTNMPGSVFLVMVYTFILFMVFPIYNTLSTLDRSQIEAARDLGAGPMKTHWRIIAPHALPGMAVGCIMTFMMAVGSLSVPYIISRGKGQKWFTELTYDKFFESGNWGSGSAYSVTLLLVSIIFVFVVLRLFGINLRVLAR